MISSVWPLPWTPGDAEDLAGARLERDVLDDLVAARVDDRDVGDVEDDVARTAPASLSTTRLTSRPTIISASSASEVEGGALPTTLPRRITVMTSPTALTSRSLWVMKMIEVPCSLSARMMSISSSISCGVSTAVGSSRISTLASWLSALMISTRCWTPTGSSSTSAVGVDREAVALGQLAHHLGGVRPVEDAAAAGVLAAEHDVLGDGEDRHEHEVLVHHADAGLDRVARRGGTAPARRRPGSRPRWGRAARRACSSASTCRRRSHRAGSGSGPARPSGRCWSLAVNVPKRLVRPSDLEFHAASSLMLAPPDRPDVLVACRVDTRTTKPGRGTLPHPGRVSQQCRDQPVVMSPAMICAFRSSIVAASSSSTSPSAYGARPTPSFSSVPT